VNTGLLEFLVPSVTTSLRGYGAQQLGNDLSAGVSASLVTLPLALAFGMLAGVGPIAGLYGAIAAGLLSSLFGAPRGLISGPTAAVSMVVGVVVASSAGNLSEAFTIVMFAGALQITLGTLRLGKYVAYAPASVVSGLMIGVGVVILITQSLQFLSPLSPVRGIAGAVTPLATLEEIAINWRWLAFSLVAFLMIIVWPKRFARYVPAPLGVLVIGTALSMSSATDIPTIGGLSSGTIAFVVPSIPPGQIPHIFQAALVVALLGSVSTFQTLQLAKSVTGSEYDTDRELVAQGIATLGAGMIGALPGAAAMTRTITSLQFGGRTSVSGILSAVLLSGLALGAGPFIAHVPLAVLTAILLKVGWDLIDWEWLRQARSAPLEETVLMSVTFGSTVLVDPMFALAVGVILAGFVNFRSRALQRIEWHQQLTFSDESDVLTAYEDDLLHPFENRVTVTLLHSSLSYAAALELARRDTQAKEQGGVVVYDLSHSTYIDRNIALAIREMIDLTQGHGRRVMLSGLQGYATRALNRTGIFERLPRGQCFDTRKAAIEAAVAYCRAN